MGVIPDMPAYVFCGGYGQIRGVDEGMAESVRLERYKKEDAALWDGRILFLRE